MASLLQDLEVWVLQRARLNFGFRRVDEMFTRQHMVGQADGHPHQGKPVAADDLGNSGAVIGVSMLKTGQKTGNADRLAASPDGGLILNQSENERENRISDKKYLSLFFFFFVLPAVPDSFRRGFPEVNDHGLVFTMFVDHHDPATTQSG